MIKFADQIVMLFYRRSFSWVTFKQSSVALIVEGIAHTPSKQVLRLQISYTWNEIAYAEWSEIEQDMDRKITKFWKDYCNGDLPSYAPKEKPGWWSPIFRIFKFPFR
jgi:hypothetical protein